MTLAKTAEAINCHELRATDRTVSGVWNLFCKLDGKPTDQAKCAFCQKRKPFSTREV